MVVKFRVLVSLGLNTDDSLVLRYVYTLYLPIFEKAAPKEQVVLLIVKLKTLNKA